MALDKVVLRGVVGGLMMGHGLQKLNGSFGGPGLDGTEQAMKGLGLYPPEYHARAVALTETIGGGLTALGFLSPLGPAMVMGTMAVAIHKVHWKNGLWNNKQGYEFNLTLIAASFALAAERARAPVDRLDAAQAAQGAGWALAAAAAAGGAATAVLRLSEKMAPSSASDSDALADEPAPVTASHHETDRPAPDLSEEGHSDQHHHSDGNGSDQDHSHHSDAYNS